MRRIEPLTAWFAALAAVAVASLALGVELFRCHGDDPAGCGMSRGFTVIAAWGLGLAVALLGVVFLAARRAAWRLAAFGLLLPVAATAALGLAETVSANLRATGRVDGLDLSRFPTEDATVRRTLRCVLAADRAAERNPAARETFAEMRQWFGGQLYLYGLREEDLRRLAAEEGAALSDPAELSGVVGGCADLTLGQRDMFEALRSPDPAP